MKRLLVLTVLACALAAPTWATALDASGELASSTKVAKKGLKVGFGVDFEGGEPVTVEDFSFKKLKMNCDQGKVFLKVKNLPDMEVIEDEFGDTFTPKTGPSHQIIVDGKFNRRATKVNGSISADGDFENSDGGGDFTNCSGSKDYEVKES